MSYFKELDTQRMNDAMTGQLSLEWEHPLDPDVWYHNIEVTIEACRRQLSNDLVERMIVFP